MLNVATLLALGDNIITLYVMRQLGILSSSRVLGTSLTRQVLKLLSASDAEYVEVSEHIPAFYDLRKQGWMKAAADVRHVRGRLREAVGKGDCVVFEKHDIRNQILMGGLGRAFVQPVQRLGIYADRAMALCSASDGVPAYSAKPSERLSGFPKRIAINPSSRRQEKALSVSETQAIIEAAVSAGAYVDLIDMEGAYQALRSTVYRYHFSPAWGETKEIVCSADLYVGPDSALIHLAYVWGIPFVVLYRRDSNLYFAPPGTREGGNFVTIPDRASSANWIARFRKHAALG